MGLPRFWGRVRAHDRPPAKSNDVGKKEDGKGPNKGAPVDDGSLPLSWTIAYYVLLVSGAVGFYLQLYPLTESGYALPVYQGSPK